MKQLVSLLLVALTLTASAQKLSNKLTFQQGQKLEMISKVNSVISMDMMGQSMETKVDATITRNFNVTGVANGNATIEHSVKRVQLNFDSPMAGGAQSMDSQNEADMKGPAGKSMEKALKNKYTMTIDPTGKISAVKGADSAKTEKNESDDMMANLMSQFATGLNTPKAGDTSEFMILPAKELSKGSSWTDSANNLKSVYTVAAVTDADIVVDYTEEGSLTRTQEAMGQEIKVTSKDKTTGKITLDRKSGLLKEKTATTSSEGNMEVAGQTMPMNTKTTKIITVKGS